MYGVIYWAKSLGSLVFSLLARFITFDYTQHLNTNKIKNKGIKKKHIKMETFNINKTFSVYQGEQGSGCRIP